LIELFGINISVGRVFLGVIIFTGTIGTWWVLFNLFLRWEPKLVGQSVTDPATISASFGRKGEDGFVSWLTPHFSFLGRATRKQYILTQIAAGVGLGFVLVCASGLIDSSSSSSQGIGILLIVLATALVCWVVLAASAKRMRDTGITVWWVLALLVPALNFAAYAFLFLVPSDEFAGRGL
jgi:uncharacterized membrane protein YhaH (DUF805 family)